MKEGSLVVPKKASENKIRRDIETPENKKHYFEIDSKS